MTPSAATGSGGGCPFNGRFVEPLIDARMGVIAPLPTEQRGDGSLLSKTNCNRPRCKELSLSRLNHWLPWAQAHPEVMQGTTEFHHEIADAVLPQADAVFE